MGPQREIYTTAQLLRRKKDTELRTDLAEVRAAAERLAEVERAIVEEMERRARERRAYEG